MERPSRLIHRANTELSNCVSLVGGFHEPLHGFAEIIVSAIAQSQAALGSGISLIGGPEESFFSGGEVSINTLAATVQETNTILSGGESLMGSLQVSLHGFRVVLRDSFTILIHVTDVVLSDWISFIQTVQTSKSMQFVTDC